MDARIDRNSDDQLVARDIIKIWDDLGAERQGRRQRSRWPWMRWYWKRKFDRWTAGVFRDYPR